MRPTEDEEDSMPPPFTVVKNAALITFSGEGTLFRLAEPVGMHYREVLFKHTGLRLPRPDVFTRAYQEVYDEKVLSSPCFGCGEALSSRDWWWSVVWDTYMEVRGGGVREQRAPASICCCAHCCISKKTGVCQLVHFLNIHEAAFETSPQPHFSLCPAPMKRKAASRGYFFQLNGVFLPQSHPVAALRVLCVAAPFSRLACPRRSWRR
jgi:hypothetical protein